MSTQHDSRYPYGFASSREGGPSAVRSFRERAAALRDQARATGDDVLRAQCLQAASEWEWLAYEVERAGQAQEMSSAS